ncbi:MAG: CRISPR-associated helicase Cas3' [Caldilineaceae bacterium]|nr:CRISPR-associated helicase Cas3' [Caldilineaceae bacterium]
MQAQEQDAQQQQVFSLLVQSWLDQTPVRIYHTKLHGARRDYVVHPYHIEPSMWNDGNYLIGYSEYHDKIARFKIARIDKVAKSTGKFREATDFDVHHFLEHAWGIWSTEEEPVTVRLRFSKWAIPRLTETVWPNATLADPAADGSRIWEMPVAEWREMLPWVRSWGSDVEVLEPVELREVMKAEVKRLLKRYAIHGTSQIQSQDRLLRCWGKTGQHEQDFHPAVFHMLDVAHVAECLLSHSTSRWRNVLSRAFNTSPDALVNWLPWMIAMHDIGKISVPFQAQNDEQKARLLEEGFDFGKWRVKDNLYHTDVGRYYLKNEFTDCQLPKWFERAWREMIGGHHGVYSKKSLDEINRELSIGIKEPNEWRELRAEANSLFKRLLLHSEPASWPEPENVSTAIMALTGFTILCDWLGSDGRYFKPRPEAEVPTYVQHSKAQARRAVTDAGFIESVLSNCGARFQDLFADRLPARPLQDAINAIPEKLLKEPCLAIIEAPTGEGKTEAALTLAHRIALHTGTDEFYCALPTTATSNQMFKRIQQHLQQRLGVSTQVKLIHGQSFLVEDDLRIEPLNPGDGEEPASLEWFSPKKRALLAPFGVGTIDQAELAALNVRHNALRLIGLAGKTVILDEVHAYDTYMTTIIEQMLRWLSALGSSVILLSATLPKARRQALVRAYGLDEPPISHDLAECVEEDSINKIDYPRLWIGSKESVHIDTPPAYNPDRPFRCTPLHIQHEAHSAKAAWLMEQIIAGGNACWICNTVERAQRLFAALPDTVEKVLIHSQLPLEERQRREQLLDERYGPTGARPSRSIVIGTQVLEQSLDLDFDLMVSDLAPIDLLLQRMGRLHRHDKNRETRPPSHEHPCLYINCELDENAMWLKMGADRFYTEYILQRTWLAIKDKGTIVLPIDYRPLVEAVYGAPKPVVGDPLYSAWEKLEKIETNARGEAKLRLLPDPTPDRPFCANDKIEFVEDEESAAWIVGQTRLGAESITLIPLERHSTQAKLVPLDEFVELNEAPTREVELRLLRRGIGVSRYEIVQHFKSIPDPSEKLFKSSSLLKSVKPLWLENGEIDIVFNGKLLHIRLDELLGLVIEKGAKN